MVLLLKHNFNHDFVLNFLLFMFYIKPDFTKNENENCSKSKSFVTHLPLYVFPLEDIS